MYDYSNRAVDGPVLQRERVGICEMWAIRWTYKKRFRTEYTNVSSFIYYSLEITAWRENETTRSR